MVENWDIFQLHYQDNATRFQCCMRFQKLVPDLDTCRTGVLHRLLKYQYYLDENSISSVDFDTKTHSIGKALSTGSKKVLDTDFCLGYVKKTHWDSVLCRVSTLYGRNFWWKPRCCYWRPSRMELANHREWFECYDPQLSSVGQELRQWKEPWRCLVSLRLNLS